MRDFISPLLVFGDARKTDKAWYTHKVWSKIIQ